MATKMEEVPCFRPELAGKTIYIIRHAQGQHNVSSRFDFDPVLTSIGLDQVLQPSQIVSPAPNARNPASEVTIS